MQHSHHPLSIIATGLMMTGIALAQDGWKNLITGNDLSGWVQKGGKAQYEIKDNSIVGTSVTNTPNSFLCPDRKYSDFILEYDFKVDPRLNSGVQIRSNSYDKQKVYQWNGKEFKVPANRFHGYQVEIDPDPKKDRWWSAGIYDEARRGWLCPGLLGDNGKNFTAKGRENFNQGDWNKVRIEAIGNSIRTWLNGKPRAAIIDDMTAEGYIGLQVHGIGKNKAVEGSQVAWRNLRIKEIKPGTGHNSLTAKEIKTGWALLWDGATTDGWRGAKLEDFPTGKIWEIKDGVLSVHESGGRESAQGGDIVTRNRFARFELQLDFKIAPGANSGIKYFCQPNLDPISGSGAKAKTGSAIGLEFQILDDAKHPDAKKGRDGNRTISSLYDLKTADPSKAPNPIGEWNTARIVTDGVHTEHWLNGKKVLEYERGSEAFKKLVAMSKYKKIPGFGLWDDGHILLQDHGNDVDYRNIKLRVPPAPKK